MAVLQRTTRPRVATRPKQSRASSPTILTCVSDLLHKGEEALKIHLEKERSEPYLGVPMTSGIIDVHDTNMPMKQKRHLISWCKPQALAPREALRQN